MNSSSMISIVSIFGLSSVSIHRFFSPSRSDHLCVSDKADLGIIHQFLALCLSGLSTFYHIN